MENRRYQVAWGAPECPFRLEYDERVLDRIGREALQSWLSLPRGGPEVGGLLLGRREEGRVVITDATPFECEHAFGPSFILSQRDEARLAEMIQTVQAAGEPQPVGWYHSHTRSEILLSAADQGVYRRFFPEPNQVALVMRPLHDAAVRAGFFFWGQDGTLHAEGSYREFLISRATAEGGGDAAEDRPSPSADGDPQDAARLDALNEHTPEAAAEPDEEAAVERAARESEFEAEPERYDEEERPEIPGTPAVAFRHWPGMAARVALVGGAVVAGFAVGRISMPRPNAGLHAEAAAVPNTSSIRLVAIDDDGQLQILWDPSAPVIQHSNGAMLEVKDGSDVQSFSIDPARLQTGSFTYGRQSQRVDVTLSVSRPEGGNLVQVTTYVGKSSKLSDAGPVVGQRELARENARLKSELTRQTERTRRLERLVEVLRKSAPKTAGDADAGAGK